MPLTQNDKEEMGFRRGIVTVADSLAAQPVWTLTLKVMRVFFFFQAEDGIRVVERSRGLGDVYKRQDYSGI